MDNVKPDDAAMHLFVHLPPSTPLFSLGRRTEPDDILRTRVFRREAREKKKKFMTKMNAREKIRSFYVNMTNENLCKIFLN